MELALSVLFIIGGLLFLKTSAVSGLFTAILGGVVFVKQVKKYQGKGVEDPMVQKAEKVKGALSGILRIAIWLFILDVVGSFIISFTSQ